VLLNPTRSVVLDVLSGMGLRINFIKMEEQCGELIGTLEAAGGVFQGGVIRGPQSAALIDELPAIAAVAPYSVQGVEIRDAAELRVKECDRIDAVVRNLRAMGAQVEEFPDGMRIPGGQHLHGARSTAATIIASPWPLPWPPCVPRVKPPFKARRLLPSHFPSSSKRWEKSSSSGARFRATPCPHLRAHAGGGGVEFEDQFGARRQGQLTTLDQNMSGGQRGSTGGADQQPLGSGDHRSGNESDSG